jgi:hypothetical protein
VNLRRILVVVACGLVLASACSSSSKSKGAGNTSATTAPAASQPLAVSYMDGFAAPGTPAKYNKVGVIKVGPANAKNVLVLEPGTSAGSAYFVPLAQWVVEKSPGWQVWSVERRENLLEDQSMLTKYKNKQATSPELYNYYLGWIKDKSITTHVQLPADSSVEFAKQWGMNVAVEDLHLVIAAAHQLGGKVVLGGHSLGGSVVTAYATWDFGGQAGAADLAGLVYIDGGSGARTITSAQATQELNALNAPGQTPWLSFGGIPAPYAGVYAATGGAAAKYDPDSLSLGQTSGLLPAAIVPKQRVTNVGQFGYALNVATSPPYLAAAQAHLGTGLSANGGWNGAGALTPIERFAEMFSGAGIDAVDGAEWYFPQRLTDDTAAVDNGNANPAQAVLGVKATMGDKLPTSLLIYAFGAKLGGEAVVTGARQLAQQSHIPDSNVTTRNEALTYAHNDPNGAYDKNLFFEDLVPFLAKVSGP